MLVGLMSNLKRPFENPASRVYNPIGISKGKGFNPGRKGFSFRSETEMKTLASWILGIVQFI